MESLSEKDVGFNLISYKLPILYTCSPNHQNNVYPLIYRKTAQPGNAAAARTISSLNDEPFGTRRNDFIHYIFGICKKAFTVSVIY